MVLTIMSRTPRLYRLDSIAQDKGYENLYDFFNKKFYMNFKQMGSELGVPYQLISITYKKFLNDNLNKKEEMNKQ